MYHFLVWRPDRMTTSRPSRSWLPLRPFWRRLARAGLRVTAVDIPQAYAPLPHPGREISGWATHEILEPPASQPPELLNWVTNTFGSPLFDVEPSRPVTITEALAARDQCRQTALLVGEMCATLMQREPWDLFLACFASTHRAGHQLWDRTSLKGPASPAELELFDDALRQVYSSTDQAIGRLLESVDEDTAVLVFSLHGMGPNTSRTELTNEMLSRILAGGQRETQRLPGGSLLDRMRRAVPVQFRSRLKNSLPIALQDRLTLFWRLRGIDWSRTRAFAAFGDLDAFIRINLKGREAAGIVEPGTEYSQLCDQIADGFRSFVDADTGGPVVGSVEYVSKTFPDGGRRDHLPDLIVHWAPTSAALHRGIHSPEFGSIDWPTPGSHPQGRSGDHARDGWLLGPDVPMADSTETASILDLAPTVHELLGLAIPSDFSGRSLLASSRSP